MHGLLPPALRGVDHQALEEYVLTEFRRLAASLAQELKPDTSEEELDLALSRALYRVGTQDRSAAPNLQLKYWHSCKFLACGSRHCALCANNPNKRCGAGDNFDNAYADNQALKARCDAPIDVELCNQATGEVFNMAGIEVQLSIIDGETYNEASPHGPFDTIVELLRSDEGCALLGCTGASGKSLADGHVIAAMQNGRARLPDVFITDKNDTFKLNEESFSSFRLLAVAVRRDEQGQLVVVDTIAPAVSTKFAVKTQRALNDYHKSEYPHSKDELTKLRYIGAITAQRLKDTKQWLGKDVPFKCVSSVADLKQLMEYADTNRQCEAKLLELLNMRGRHRHKWDFLRSLLAERMVSDDNTPRVWYSADGVHGLLFTCKQAQINFDKPAGLVQRVIQNGSVRVQVVPPTDASHQQTLRTFKQQAEDAWHTPGHRGWQVLTEPYEYTNSPGVFITGGNTSPLASSGHNAAFSDLPTSSQATTTATPQVTSAPDPRSVFASAAHAGLPGATALPGAAGGSFATSAIDGSIIGDPRSMVGSFTSTRDGSFVDPRTLPGSFTSSRPDGSFVDPRTLPGSFTSSVPDGSFTDPRSSDPGSFVSSQRDGSFVSMQGRLPAIGPITGGFVAGSGLPQHLFGMATDQDVSTGAAQSMSGIEGYAGAGFMGTARMAAPRGHTITSGTSRDHRGLAAAGLASAHSAPEQDMYPVMGPAHDGNFGVDAQVGTRHLSMDNGMRAPAPQQQEEDDQDEDTKLPPGYTDVEFVEDAAVLAALRRSSHNSSATTKRNRSNAAEASGPSTSGMAAAAAQDKGLYHLVSAGRHMPRHRSNTDDIPSSGDVNAMAKGGAAAADDEDDDVFVTASDGLNGDASPFADALNLRNSSTLSLEDTGALSNSFRDSLHLDASMEEQFCQLDKLLAGDPTLRRRLKRNESDSFKRMIPDSILDSPTHGPAASSIDAWLDHGNGTKARMQGN